MNVYFIKMIQLRGENITFSRFSFGKNCGVGSLGKVVSGASKTIHMYFVLTVYCMYKRTVNSTVQYREWALHKGISGSNTIGRPNRAAAK